MSRDGLIAIGTLMIMMGSKVAENTTDICAFGQCCELSRNMLDHSLWCFPQKKRFLN